MRRLLVVAAAAAGMWACGDGASEQAAQDTLTRRQRDSIISEMPLPGAHGVGAALEAQDRLNARAQQHDTIR